MKKAALALCLAIVLTACGDPGDADIASDDPIITTSVNVEVTTEATTTPEMLMDELGLSTMYPNICYQLYLKMSGSSVSKEAVLDMISSYSDIYSINDLIGSVVITDELVPDNKLELWFSESEGSDTEILSSMNYSRLYDHYTLYIQDDRRYGGDLSFSVDVKEVKLFKYETIEDAEQMMFSVHGQDISIPHEVMT